MPSLVVIGTQIKDKQRGTQCAPLYMVPKDPSLNRVKSSCWHISAGNSKLLVSLFLFSFFSDSSFHLLTIPSLTSGQVSLPGVRESSVPVK